MRSSATAILPARRLLLRKLVLCAGLLAGPTTATADTSGRCDSAAQQAALATDVPLPVMRAITRVETGRLRDGELQPWPWAVNLGGDGYWFKTAQEARRFAAMQVMRGRRNMDIGCFQVNYRWHGDGFRSTDEMFDPEANALYAAGFLSRLQAEHGDWNAAVAAYHSRTPKYAQRYLARYRAVLAGLQGQPVPSGERDRENGFPLLQAAGAVQSRGSLTPLGPAPRPLVDLAGG